MQIQKIDNTPNFGLRYVKPRKWNPDVLQKLMDSSFLIYEINKKFPGAKVESYKDTYNYHMNFYLKKGLEIPIVKETKQELIDYLKNMNLTDLLTCRKSLLEEKEAAEKVFRVAEFSNKNESQSIFKKIFKH